VPELHRVPQKRATLFSIKLRRYLLDFFYIFLPVETGRNTVQFSYLMAWWRHNSVAMHVTKVYFIQLVIKIKYVEFEDNTKHF